jgi:hypothetical protein
MLFLPAVYMLLVSFLLERIFRKYIPDAKRGDRDEQTE